MGTTYFKGFNGLRFIASVFVLVSHAAQTVTKLGWVPKISWAALSRGHDAVEFFFTLSGFLITYLLLQEKATTHTVSISQFYLRRVLRIWPVYFLVLALGFGFLQGVYPVLYNKPYFNFEPLPGLAAFVLFLPNLMATSYRVGLLYPLWSIGVEEQFYLFWAPLARYTRFGLSVIGGLTLIFGLVMVANELNLLGLPAKAQAFIATLKFYDMGVGALGALTLHRSGREAFVKHVLLSRPAQAIVLALLIGHYLVGIPGLSGTMAFSLVVPWLYLTLLLQQSLSITPLASTDHPSLVRLGQISYGIYMYHMLVDYALRLPAARLHPPGGGGRLAGLYPLRSCTASPYHCCRVSFLSLLRELLPPPEAPLRLAPSPTNNHENPLYRPSLRDHLYRRLPHPV